MTESIELLDILLHLDERRGLEYAFLSIRPNTRITDPEDPAVLPAIVEAVVNQLKQKKIGHGIIPKSDLIAEITRYLADYDKIRAQKTFFTFPLAAPSPPQPGIDGNLEILIELKLKPGKICNEKTGKIDYHDLGFSENLIHQDEPLAIITHATAGRDGIDIFSRPIKARPGQEAKLPSFDRKTIYRTDNPEFNQTILRAGSTGFLYHEPERGYFISKDVLAKEINFSIGNIEVNDFSEIDSTIKISGNKDILHESVKPGFSLKSREIIIDGNVGRGATIEGDSIIISGIVDSQAKVIGRRIEIGKVIGAHVEGDEIKINQVVQNATISGREIRIGSCLSSTILGEEIYIERELRSSTLSAARFIFCQSTRGTIHSNLSINPLVIPSFLRQLEKQRLTVEKQRQLFQAEKQKLIRQAKLHEGQHRPQVEKFYRQVEEAKKISLNTGQRKVLEQLLAQGRLDDIMHRLKLKFYAETRHNLENFAKSLELLHSLESSTANLERKFNQESSIQRKMEEAHKLGLILIGAENSGEAKICFGDHSLAPSIYNHKLLFYYDAPREQILGLEKFGLRTQQKLLSQISSRALGLINELR
ncbi:MAG TPA: DUF342 domain-containing protein [Proteobacteria bacterium]|nr:DUF342 domain-containing protein [Pseudomonadota bacterium]